MKTKLIIDLKAKSLRNSLEKGEKSGMIKNFNSKLHLKKIHKKYFEKGFGVE